MNEEKPYMTRVMEGQPEAQKGLFRFLKKEIWLSEAERMRRFMEEDRKLRFMKEEEQPAYTQGVPDRIDEERKQHATQDKSKILRFRKSERLVHWALAVPFLICFATAVVLVFYYNPDPLRPYRNVFSWVHRVSGICLIILPMLAIIRSRNDWRIYFYNIRQAWVWTLDDIKWLSLMGIAAVNKKVKLPEQGKFNAAEKINFMKLMSSYPLYILTGALIWLTDAAFLSWILHFAMALLATPLVLGHLYMAMINPESRKGLDGMFSGFVDRHWAKHHYGKWYSEHFENNYGFETVQYSARTALKNSTAYEKLETGIYLKQQEQMQGPEEKVLEPVPASLSKPQL